MTWPRLTIRVQLTLLYTGLFAVCGAIVVAITYALVLANLPEVDDTTPVPAEAPAAFMSQCLQTLSNTDTERAERFKCEAAFRDGVLAGARAQREVALANLLRYLVITLVAVTLVAALTGWLVAGRVLRRVHRITAAARAASQHNLSARVALSGPRDELRELGDTFDEMLGRLERSFKSQRQFIANAGHELRTPLTVMRTAVDVVMAQREPTQPEIIGMGRAIRASVGHAEKLLAALLMLARNEHGLTTREPVDLATIAEDALDSVERGDRHEQPSLRPAVVRGDPVLLERLVVNLLDNALRYNNPGGQVWITTAVVDGKPTLTVANTGPPIQLDRVSLLFEPFRRLHDRTGHDGFGLGLTIVASIAAIHDATVTAHPRAEGGLTITVPFPSPSNSAEFGEVDDIVDCKYPVK